tara:strand:- start:83 stop:571 length:489 start_codon:yes stop_codon:yes gene_type:complete
MKKLLLVLLCLPFIGFGQMATPSVVSNAGQTFSNGNIIIDFTIGEVVIETFQPTITPLPLVYNILTQGFHQDKLNIQTIVENIKIKTKVYPNPTSNILVVELEKNITADLLVYDINGKIVLSDNLLDQNQKQLDFSFLKQGNYFLHINSLNNKSVYQINKSK